MENKLREAALAGVRLPEGKTKSEKQIIQKVKTDLGLPQLGKTKSEKEILDNAHAAGLIIPLEGKNNDEKETILRMQAKLGIPLPEGRTKSEKALIKQIKSTQPTKIDAAEKLRKAKENGYLTPINGKSLQDKEKIIKGLAMLGLPLPKGVSESENNIIDKVRKDVGLPIEPKTSKERKIYNKGIAVGIITPLEGKSNRQKEKIIKQQAMFGVPLPEGRTASEKSLIAKIKKRSKPLSVTSATSEVISIPSAKIKKAKAEGLFTPLKDKNVVQRENILKGLAFYGIPLPKGETDSQQNLINKVRRDLGLPLEPKTPAEKKKYKKAAAAGLIVPLEGKSKAEKEKLLQEQASLGINLPEGRTTSEKSLIKKIKKKAKLPSETSAPSEVLKIPSEKIKKAKAEGLLTPLQGKSPEQKEKILRGLAMNGIPLPKGKSDSERNVIEKVRQELGLPREPKTPSETKKYKKAAAAGLLVPLEGKTTTEKEKLLKDQANFGINSPNGRTTSEKALIKKVKEEAKLPSETSVPSAVFKIPSAKVKKAKAEGLLTPLQGKSPDQKEKILRGLAMNGIPLPKGKSDSERNVIEKVRQDLGLPLEPKTLSETKNYKKAAAAGLLVPLEGKTKAEKEKLLKDLANLGINLPNGRTTSEKALIKKIKEEAKLPSETSVPSEVLKIPPEKIKKAKAEGLMTPLQGKSPEQKEKILRGLAMNGIPLPKGKSDSERNVIEKVRQDLGLPLEPKTLSETKNYKKAAAAGLLVPLEGKTKAEKEKLLKDQANLGIRLPNGRTTSEKALIKKVKEEAKLPSETSVPSDVFKIPSAKIKKAKAEGLMTPLQGKSPEQKEKILRGLAMNGIPLPKGKSDSERNIIEKVRQDLGLPLEPKTPSEIKKYRKGAAAGLIVPLDGKTKAEKEKLLQEQASLGINLPEGRTTSEKSLIKKIKKKAKLPAETSAPSEVLKIPSAKIKKAKAEGLFTPLQGKSPEQKEKILRGLAMNGIPLPKGKSDSERNVIEKMRQDLGLPLEPKTPSEKKKYKKAAAAGLLVPLEGKTKAEKEKLLKDQAKLGINLPNGRTTSEKALIRKVKEEAKLPSETSDSSEVLKIPPEKIKKAKAEGLMTPLQGKSPEQKEKILRGLAMNGIPLPKGKSDSERNVIEKVRQDLGLPLEPKTPSETKKYKKAAAAGLLVPLEGKTKAEKEKLLKDLANLGINLPNGRTTSEKALIKKIKEEAKLPSETSVPSEVLKIPPEKIKKAKAEGLMTPLQGKSPEQKEKILRGLAMNGIPLPKGKSDSERNVIEKVRQDLGLPLEPKTPSETKKYKKAAAAGLLVPLEGKTKAEKEKLLKDLANLGINLPNGRTTSEKALIKKIKEEAKLPSETSVPSEVLKIPPEKIKKAKAEGLMTPLQGKSPEQKEKILRGLAINGIPLPKGKSDSERNVIEKVRQDLGLPLEPKTPSETKNYKKAAAAGLLVPLEGKTKAEKEKLLKDQANLGIRLPNGRTTSEKALIKKVKEEAKLPSETSVPSEFLKIPSAKIKKAKAEGLFTPLIGKSPEIREKILRGLAMNGIPLPEAKSESERKLVDKVRKDLGLPGEPKTRADKSKYKKAVAAGLITPLEGKSFPEKEKLLKGMVNAGFSLPEGRTTSEKLLIARIHDTGKKIKKAKAEGLLTPLQGKSNESKEKILRGLAMHGIPLPEGQTPSENAIIDKVRDDLGLPIPPTIGSDKEKYAKAQATGIITPLEGKLKPEKEKILRAQAALGIPLPKGRTPSERVLIKRIIETPPEQLIFSEIPKEDKEKILKDLAMQGEVFPVPANDSEKKILEKVRRDLGLPPEPKSTLEKNKYNKAQAAGIIVPLQGKSRSQREIILQKEADFGLELPEGRTASEKELVNNVKRRRIKRLNYLKKLDTKTAKNITEGKGPSDECICGLLTPEAPIDTKKEKTLPSEILKDAADAGLFTPLKGKSPEQKEKIIKGLALQGLPLPKEESPSDKILIDKVRKEIGLPPEPKSSLLKDKYNLAQIAGIITPLEGKTKAEKKKILTKLAELGIPLPEGRSNSETDLINEISATVPRRITSDKFRKARSDGLLTPITGKPFSEKERILRALATLGLPLPVGKTSSEKKIIHKIKSDLGVTTVPIPPEKLQQAKAAGLLTPLTGKTESQKKKIVKELALLGIPIPKAQTVSDKKIIEKVRKDVGLPPEPKTSSLRDKYKYAELAGIIKPLEGKTPVEKKNLLTKQAEIGIPLPEGRTQSEKDLIRMIQASVPKKVTSEKIRKAMAAGILTPITGKSQNEKERILRVLASEGLPLPEGQTTSDKKLIQKIKSEMGITSSLIPSEILRKAKAAGLLTPLKGKTYPQKEKVVKGLALHGIPLPTAQTASEKQIIDKVRKDVGLPPEPKSSSVKNRYKQAQKSGFITPLEGKSKAQKENILRKQAAMGIPLPEGRTQSEKDLINKIRKEIPKHVASERLRKAKAAGLLTPLRGKTPEEKSKILEKLAKSGLPLPEGKTPSEKLLISKLRSEMGIPLDGISSEMLRKAEAAGLITPLTGKSIQQKEKILKGRVAAGLPLPKGMSPSDQALVKKFKEKTENISPLTKKSKISIPSEKIKAAKEAGLITPLKGKSPEQKEKIIKGLAMRGIPLPRPETPSEIEIVDKVRKDVGLPQEPKSSSLREKYKLGHVAGIMTPLEGKTASQKKIILRKQAELGIPLPEGRTKSEKDIIKAIQDTIPKKVTSEKIRKSKATRTLTGKRTAEGLPLREGKTSSEKKIVKKIQSDMSIIAVPNLSDKLKKAKAAGLLTPLKGKTVPEKEKILKRLALLGIPLPKGQTASEKKIIDKVWKDVGLPPEPKTSLIKNKYREAQLNGIITPLEGKSVSQKENILMKLAEMGIPLPEGRTKTEKDLIAKVQAKFPADLYEKGVQTKSRKVGLGPVKRSEIGVGVSGKSQAGIREKFEDIVKTTKCDRGCGCDRKKIRFKHSYVKIRVTSPDISSLCPCPDECLPGVKTGVFTDSEGIKVTVGHATGSTSFDYKKWRVQTGSRSHLTLTDLTEKKNSKFHLKLTHNDKKVLSTTRSYPYLKKYLKAARYAQNSVSHVETVTDVTSNITTSSNSIFSFCFGRKSSSASFKTNTSLNSDDMISMISYSISSSISSSISEETDLLNYLYCKKKEKISVEDLLNEYSTNLKYRDIKRLPSSKIVIYTTTLSDPALSTHYSRINDEPTNINESEQLLDFLDEIIFRSDPEDSSSSYYVVVSSSSTENSSSTCLLPWNTSSTIYIKLRENESTQDQKPRIDVRGIKFSTHSDGLKFSEYVINDKVNAETIQKCCFDEKANGHDYCQREMILKQTTRYEKSCETRTDTTQDNPCNYKINKTIEVGVQSQSENVTCQSELKCQCELDKLKTLIENICRDLIYSTIMENNLIATENMKLNTEKNQWCHPKPVKEPPEYYKYKLNSNSNLTESIKCPCEECALSTRNNNCENYDTYSRVKSKEKRKLKNSKVVCDCPPPEEEEEEEFDPIMFIDDRKIRQFRSHMSQSMSGFKLNVVRKGQMGEDNFANNCSFNESVDVQEPPNKFRNNDCKCPKSNDPNVICPPSLSQPTQLRGLKLHIDGKGSLSKGLNGVLCFEVLSEH
ncbi:uncharacterized protein LOC126978333 isoform X4 [Leptidea sinapis]|uniref:uncharacterized protein LOC126978333 isoform X4 n=1 Tax=Leptidea sinapis TaxID=189913 RepID=UPI0021C30B6F|nr:uncharacterized protein LOC126978333 isoform X4 [Leptidea sinapis]